ncbi:MAG: AAA family ATPase [Lachnospiraceae bacterium]|nr:AAA family ATPase [Lachnospiraceae bacterium]
MKEFGRSCYKSYVYFSFDEEDELNTLKYFKEKANDYHVIAAGSLPGTLLAQPKSYPVGMMNLLELYPLTFDEFLEAVAFLWSSESYGRN